MALVISTDAAVPDAERRSRVFDGEVFAIPPSAAVRAMSEFAWELIVEAFEGDDPSLAYLELPVEEYVARLAVLKPKFTHHPRNKELLAELLVALGCDPESTYFDVPKLRVVTPKSYLSSGLGYNYQPHRDTWYSAPQCQVNWWAPIRNVSHESCMSFHPDYWCKEVANSSADFDAYEWNSTSRRDAAKYITSDPRPHPHLLEPDPGSDVRIVGDAGSILCFSGAHLHATVPSTARLTRFSFDFRTVHIEDVATHAGPPNVDSASTGTSLRDYIRCTTHEQLPSELIAEYDIGGAKDGVLVFDPAVLSDQG
jgi:hypothetical protein